MDFVLYYVLLRQATKNRACIKPFLTPVWIDIGIGSWVPKNEAKNLKICLLADISDPETDMILKMIDVGKSDYSELIITTRSESFCCPSFWPFP